MDETLSQKIAEADLPAPLKTSIENLLAELRAFEPNLSKRKSWRLGTLTEHLVKEVTDPDTEVHWWELALDLAVKWSAELGQASTELQAAAANARQEISAYFEDDDAVELVEINEDTVNGILWLSDTLSDAQRGMVADNATSLSQAHFNKYAWFRAIYAGKAPVGFLMLYDNPEDSEYFLWRFMIAAPFQGRGYGREAIERLVDYVRTRPNPSELGVSCGQGEASPEEFYKRLGFIPTGEIDGDEIVLTLKL